jgi:hypothetical protein
MNHSTEAIVITIAVFAALLTAVAYIWKSESFREYSMLVLAPLTSHGTEAECKGAFVTSNEPGEAPSDWFRSRTLILGHDKDGGKGAGEATFYFSLPRKLLSDTSGVSAYLSIHTERIHGGLHSRSGPRRKRAKITANGSKVDEFWLIDKMPYGEHYGYRNLDPILLDNTLLANDTLVVTLSIEDEMAWDIDRVSVQITKVEKRLTVHGSMWLGAFISAGCGLGPTVLQGISELWRKFY